MFSPKSGKVEMFLTVYVEFTVFFYVFSLFCFN